MRIRTTPSVHLQALGILWVERKLELLNFSLDAAVGLVGYIFRSALTATYTRALPTRRRTTHSHGLFLVHPRQEKLDEGHLHGPRIIKQEYSRLSRQGRALVEDTDWSLGCTRHSRQSQSCRVHAHRRMGKRSIHQTSIHDIARSNARACSGARQID